MEIKPDRMVSLGYGKYWRSDAIVGLMPIEEDRGPGRRTEVYTATLEHPLVASRSENAILQDMAIASEEVFRMHEAREIVSDMVEALEDIPDVIRRRLTNEADFDVNQWSRRLQSALRIEAVEPSPDQNDLFAP